MPGEAVVVSGVRTPIGKFGRGFRNVSARHLGSIVIQEAVERAGIRADQVDEVIMGNVISAGSGQNPARQAAVSAKVPPERGSFTVNKVCGSGLKAVMLAAQAIRAGDADVVVAGGMENMSAAPHVIRDMRWGVKVGDATITDAMLYDGLWDAFNDYHMGLTGERIAGKYGITREEADEFSLGSHRKALKAIQDGKFRNELIPVTVEDRIIEKDEGVREDTSLEKLAGLPPVFKKGGILTAGNSSQLSDGAAALTITSSTKAGEMGLEPMARIIGYATGGVKPEDVMEAPIPTVKKLLDMTGLTMDDMDLVEHNEAYATASIAVMNELGIDPQKFNVNGGAIALGHPIGCSGARILVTLLHAIIERGLTMGLATLCLGGGNAVAMIIERWQT